MSYPFIPARLHSEGHNLPCSRIVIHGTVSATKVGGARANAAYFQSANAGGSAQYLVDPAWVIQAGQDDTICWHAPPNKGSIGIEFCDWVNWKRGNGKTVADIDPFWKGKTEADFNARWSLPDWDKMLRLGAELVHDLAVKHRIPATRLSVADLLAGREGICGHVDVSKAWHQTDHSDPGASFPWDKFILYVQTAGGAVAPGPVIPPAGPPVQRPHPVPKPGVLTVDGGLGPATIRRWQQVMGTPVDGKISNPSSLVSAVQRRLNAALGGADLTVDGRGIVQDGKRYKTVEAMQRYLGTTPDGVLSVPSSGAVKALQTHLNASRF